MIVSTSAENTLDRPVLDGALDFLHGKAPRKQPPILWLDRRDGVHDDFFRKLDVTYPGLLRPLGGAFPRPALTYHPEPIEAADGVVFLGGVGGTYDAGHAALASNNKSLVFVGAFGGASALLAREERGKRNGALDETLARLQGAWTDDHARMICEVLETVVSVRDLVLVWLAENADRVGAVRSHTDRVASEIGCGSTGPEVHETLLQLRDIGAFRDLYIEGDGNFRLNNLGPRRSPDREAPQIHHRSNLHEARSGEPPAHREEVFEVEDRVLVSDEDMERVVVWLPRGCILIDDLGPSEIDSWSVKLHHYDVEGEWVQSDHFHESYDRQWLKEPERQLRKLGVPRADWSDARVALDVARELRKRPRTETAKAVVKNYPKNVEFFLPLAPIHLAPISAAEAARGRCRDAAEELDELAARSPGSVKAPEVELAFREAISAAQALLGKAHSLVKRLEKLGAATNAATLLERAAQAASVVRSAARESIGVVKGEAAVGVTTAGVTSHETVERKPSSRVESPPAQPVETTPAPAAEAKAVPLPAPAAEAKALPPPASAPPTNHDAESTHAGRRAWMPTAMGAAAIIVASGAIYYLVRPPSVVGAIDSGAVPADPCTDLNRQVESLQGAKQTQARKLSAMLGDAGLAVEGSDTVEETVKTTYVALGERNEACRLLLASVQCADKRKPDSQVALKLADAVTMTCTVPAPAPAAPERKTAVSNGPTPKTAAPAAPAGKGRRCKAGTVRTMKNNMFEAGGGCVGQSPADEVLLRFKAKIEADSSYCVPFAPSDAGLDCCCITETIP